MSFGDQSRAGSRHRRPLVLALALVSVFMVVEIVAGDVLEQAQPGSIGGTHVDHQVVGSRCKAAGTCKIVIHGSGPLGNFATAVAKDHGACGILKKGDLEAGKWPADPYFFPLYEEANRLDLAGPTAVPRIWIGSCGPEGAVQVVVRSMQGLHVIVAVH